MDSKGKATKGEVFIRSNFREPHESAYRLCREQMILDQGGREAVGAEGGPFCYVNAKRLMPF